jgi:hypothetical protein
MVNSLALQERIAIVRENLRQLVEQAAAYAGSQDDQRTADRIEQQTKELERLIAQQDALSKR